MIDFRQKTVTIKRSKKGRPTTQPLGAREVGYLRKLYSSRPLTADGVRTRWVFHSMQGGKMTCGNFYRIVTELGRVAGLPFPIHPHMLRHSCGFKLANDGKDLRVIQHYLGHKNIQHTVRYTELSPKAFEGLWTD